MVTLLLSHQAAVRSMMDQIVEETVPPPSLLSEMCQHHLAAGGKGFRSSLCLSLCEALGADPEDCLPAAVCLELVHRTSLVFDDIQDRTPERNGQPALWEKYGMEQSLNAGLALSGCARMALTKLTGPSLPEGVALRTLQIMETSLVRLCWGQCLDLQQQNGGPPNLLEYLQMVRLKTGALLGACCEVAGLLTGKMDPSLPKFGEQLGILFQYQDDYLGIWGDPEIVGKTPTDLVEGKRSLPVVVAHGLYPDGEVSQALSSKATERLHELVCREEVQVRTLKLVELQQQKTLRVLTALEETVSLPQEAVERLIDLVNFTARREA